MGEFFTSVHLEEDLCKGCINCIKRCPTQAIRVRNGKAVITKEFCIDCGECIRICPHHAKKASYDSPDVLNKFEYRVALPPPSLYGQFNNLEDVNIVLTALKKMGFDDVYEVSGAAELVSEMTRAYVANHRGKWPIISTACPTVVRLIQVRFPNLIDHLLPICAPVDLAASTARKKAMDKTGLPSEKIGVVFISPCPAKVTAVKAPIGIGHSEIDAVLAMKEVYPMLLPLMKKSVNDIEELGISGRIGIGWGSAGGEAGSLLTDNYLAADGIENVIRVLEDLEDQKFDQLEFIELNACSGGCVGGVLTVENPYVAKVKLKRLRKYLPVARTHLDGNQDNKVEGYWTDDVKYEPVFNLGKDMREGIANMTRVVELCEKFPGLDCGSCGAPTCKALAEDIVRGVAQEQDCIYILRDYIHRLSNELSKLDRKKE
ncbi:MAG TPA: 4Fe-4S dicluster domain-containing protein [Clostridiales bacterium]|jgi:iron only hydrogenase large subunit-like protein|nr:4Fe-4S dicluster domain-containing protein [Clostridiales bacterium]